MLQTYVHVFYIWDTNPVTTIKSRERVSLVTRSSPETAENIKIQE